MKSPFALIPCLLALAISVRADLVDIAVTSPTDNFPLPAGSAGAASVPITYTVTPSTGNTITSLVVTFGGEPCPATAITAGKQSASCPVPATFASGSYPMLFTEKYNVAGLFNLTSTPTTATATYTIVIAAAASSSATPSPTPSSTSAAPSSTSTSSSISSAPASSLAPASSSSFSSISISRTSISIPTNNASFVMPSFYTSGSSIIMVTPSITPSSNATTSSSSTVSQNTPVIIGSVCGFVAILAAGFGYAFLSKTRKNRRKERVFGDDDAVAIPPPAPFDSPRAVGGVVGAPTAEERPDSWEPEVKHAPGALYTTSAAPPPAAYYQPQPGYGAYNQQQQYAPGYYQQQQPQAYQQNPDIQLQNAQNWAGQYPQHNNNYEGYQGQGEYGYR